MSRKRAAALAGARRAQQHAQGALLAGQLGQAGDYLLLVQGLDQDKRIGDGVGWGCGTHSPIMPPAPAALEGGL
jgi:hypothetical protein